MKDRIDVNSDSIKGSLETSHIFSARSISAFHSSLALLPKLSRIAANVSYRERLVNLTLAPSAKR